ncbi:hypothetical protein [Actinokineospora sp. NPDC004072]
MPFPSADGWTTAITAGLAAWFGITVASQHPHPMFDRFREYDVTGLGIANWRFFAPEPAQHDLHVLHRVLGVDGVTSPWTLTAEIPERRWRQAVWFPDRRGDKALFDVCHELLQYVGRPETKITGTAAYKIVVDSVERRVRTDHATAKGFQFVIARSAGYDEEPDPDYLLVSPFVPLTGNQVPA